MLCFHNFLIVGCPHLGGGFRGVEGDPHPPREEQRGQRGFNFLADTIFRLKLNERVGEREKNSLEWGQKWAVGEVK